MANVLHRTTKQYLISVNTPDYDPSDWIINPDLSNVVGLENKYWKISGDTVLAQDSGEQAATDAAELSNIITQAREGAKAILARDNEAEAIRLRAIVELMIKSDNYIIARLIELQNRVQAMIDASPINTFQSAGSAVSISSTTARTKTEVVQQLRDDIDAGNSDGGV